MAKPAQPNSIDEYIAGFPPETRKMLEEMRAIVRSVVPAATERISYALPTFDLDGQPLAYFAGWKKHVSFYPAPSGVPEWEEALKPYKTSKATVQFPLGQPLPVELIRRLVEFRVQQMAEKAAG
jgi:uncharacterized protein YdhG (YjbR/CyaY superfamily)